MKGAIMATTNTSKPSEDIKTAANSGDIDADGLESMQVALSEDTARRDIASLQAGGQSVWSSIQGEDFESRLKVADAVVNSTPLRDHLGEKIMLRHIVAQATTIADRQTGEITPVVRLVLIDEDGTAYNAMSGGLFKSIENLIGILGMPAYWPGPVPVKINREGKVGEQYYTLKFA